MTRAHPPFPPSPFGPAPTSFGLEGAVFGAFVKSGYAEGSLPQGFFFDAASFAPKLEAYAAAVPGSTLGEALLATGLPPPIKALLASWPRDWRSTWRASRPVGSGASLSQAAQAYPSAILRQRPASGWPIFSWIAATAPVAKHWPEAPEIDLSAQAAELWRSELESQGIATFPWTGRGLDLLNRGHISDDCSSDALARYEAARLRRELPMDPQSLPASRRSL